MNCYYSTFPTPAGEFSVGVDEAGAVIATAFGGEAQLQLCAKDFTLVSNAARAEPAKRQILEYWSGDRRAFDIPLAPRGTVFQKSVWNALRAIPHGETRSYGEIASAVGQPTAARAVGRANATNPICLIVPCHRVIGSGGRLVGFAYGETVKRRLLIHEGALLT